MGTMSKKKNEMAYHYAGKVHVRGLLRRVWRPRYLALGDDGYLRYHESIPPVFQQPGSKYSQNMYNNMVHHTHRPKSTLAILDGARTINPNSVVDQHVALPEGFYGFVFRGRPVELSVSSPSAGGDNTAMAGDSMQISENFARNAVIVPSRSQTKMGHDKHQPAKAVVNAFFPKGTSRRKAAQKFAKAAINPDVLCGIGRNCERGHLSFESSFSLMGCDQQFIDDDVDSLDEAWTHGYLPDKHLVGVNTTHVQVQAASIQSREYLCAVSTAEEAESWVVALRWASERRRTRREERRMGHNNIDDRTRGKNKSIGIGSLDELIVSGTEESSACHDGCYGRDSKETLGSTENSWCQAETAEKADEDEVLITEDGLTAAQSTSESTTVISTCLHSDNNAKDTNYEQDLAHNSRVKLAIDFDKANIEANNKSSQQTLATNNTTTHEAHAKSSLQSSNGNHLSTQETRADIVVTKVVKPRLRFESSFRYNLPIPLPGEPLNITYEVHVLLLKDCQQNDTSLDTNTSCTNSDHSSFHPRIQELNISTSIQDLLLLLDSLRKEFGTKNISGNEIYHSTMVRSTRTASVNHPDTIQRLRELEASLLSGCRVEMDHTGPVFSSKLNETLSEIFGTMKKVDSTVRQVDRVIKSLSSDSVFCNSEQFREFLSLNRTTPIKHPTEGLDGNGYINQIIRNWLSQNECPSHLDGLQLCASITLRHPFGGPLLSLVSLWTLFRCLSWIWSSISYESLVISVPVETYVTLVAVSFYYGHWTGMNISRRVKLSGLRKNELTYTKTADDVVNSTSFLSCDSMADSDDHSTDADETPETRDDLSLPEVETPIPDTTVLSSPLPMFPDNKGISCWTKPSHSIFMVRSKSYLVDRLKMPSSPAVFECRGVDVWLTDNAARNISRHPSMLGGKLNEEDTFIVNFLLPFANLVAYFTVKPMEQMPPNIARVWQNFIEGNQEYRDGKLKLLPVVVDGPWIVKKAVGPGTSPAMIGRDLPLQYYFTKPTQTKKGVYEVDVLVTASRIARGILNIVKGHTKSLAIAFAFIIEAAEQTELPESVLAAFQIHSLHLEDCPCLPDHSLFDRCD